MKKGNTIGLNTLVLMAGQIVQRLLALSTTVLVVRYLGPEHYGQLTFVITLVTLGSVFWDFGLNTLITKEVAGNTDLIAAHSGGAILIKSGLMIPVAAAMAFYLSISGYPSDALIAFGLFAAGTFLSNLTGVFHAVFFALHQMEYSAALDTLRGVVFFILISATLFFSPDSKDLVRVVACYFAVFVLTSAIVTIIFVNRFGRPRFSTSFQDYLRLGKAAVPFVLTSMVNLILFRIDHLMISKLAGDFALGLYGAVYTIFEVIISFFPMIIMTSTFPVLAECFKNDRQRMAEIFNMLLKYFIVLSLPMSVGLILLREDIVWALYGSDYSSASSLLGILGACVWIFFLTTLISWTLTAADRQKIVFASNLIVMLANIVLNLLFIPRYGAQAAAAATLACEGFQLILMGSVLRTIMPFHFMRDLFKSALACLLMIAFILLLRRLVGSDNYIANLAFIIPLASGFYLGVSYWLRSFRFKEIKALLFS
jgi:O-antigen/teichoic acid export membrane protein